MRQRKETELPEVWRGEFLATCEIHGKGLCCVQRFITTCGLLTNVTFAGLTYGYSARYCYPSKADALLDLFTWDGTGDPPGEWIKEKVSGRPNPRAEVP